MLNYDEGDYSERNEIIAVSTTQVLISRAPVSKIRKNITITNTSAGAQIITIHRGVSTAVAGAGIVLNNMGQYTDSTISPNARCYQGTIYAIANAINGQISISEEFE